MQRINRSHPWMLAEVYRIAQIRFGTTYDKAIHEAIESCLESHSVVVAHPNKEKSLIAFVLVCPPTTKSSDRYGIRSLVQQTPHEIAFCATDVGWEGKGLARRMLDAVLDTALGFWLHVDVPNIRARKLYESLGFRGVLQIPDPYGADGILMRLWPR